MCASSGSMVVPSVARIATECGMRIRKADARVCVCARGEGRPGLEGLSTPPWSLSPSSFPALHTCTCVVPVMCGWE